MNSNIKLMVVMTKMNYAFLKGLSKNLESLGITTSEYTMLAHLNDVEKAKTQKLGEVSMITSGTITHLINKMIKLSYVVKEQDSEDKRVFWIKITDEGRQVFHKIHKEHMLYLDELLSDFTEDDKNEFIEMVKYFGKHIEEKVVANENK
jgi:MarR family 2-MHQ and catechol resistance regulon transcriptional repressor